MVYIVTNQFDMFEGPSRSNGSDVREYASRIIECRNSLVPFGIFLVDVKGDANLDVGPNSKIRKIYTTSTPRPHHAHRMCRIYSFKQTFFFSSFVDK